MNVVSKVKDWITPGLIAIITFFAKGWIDDVNKKLDRITDIKEQVTTISVNQVHNTADLAESKSDIKNLQASIFLLSEARKEDELTLESLKHR